MEKIAYRISLIRPGKNPESDWKRAQIAFAYYTPLIITEITENSPEIINLASYHFREYLERRAHEIHKQNPANSSFDNWIIAQNELARLTAQLFKEEEIKVQEIKQKELDLLCWEIEKNLYSFLSGFNKFAISNSSRR